jgi:predicted nucleotidyltransferase component of viral defense system
VKAKPVKNMAASVRDRLLKLAHERGEDFQLVLIHYALERLLYRLSQSKYRERFVLKGAMLFSLWTGEPHRATSDLDLLGRGDNEIEALTEVFREICAVRVDDDGLEFKTDSIRGEQIRDSQEYVGVRLTFETHLAAAHIPIQVDVGFGDAVSPAPETVEYPILLDLPAPRVLAYPREAVVAEKFQAMVALGIANSRMKDFYDLWMLARQFAFEGPKLSAAIRATFDRRQTPVPAEPPLAMTAMFHDDPTKQTQWSAFLQKGKLGTDAKDLGGVISFLHEFLMLPTVAAAGGKPFAMHWLAGGPWQASPDKKRR